MNVNFCNGAILFNIIDTIQNNYRRNSEKTPPPMQL